MEPFLGQVMLFAGNFAPRGWAFCNGQLMSIAQNTALFSILGTTYGGDGITTFALPDLRGRSPVAWGQGPGLSPIDIGEKAGTESVTLALGNMPIHTHPATPALTAAQPASNHPGDTDTPGPTTVPAAAGGNTIYSNNDPDTSFKGGPVSGSINVGTAGGSQPFANRSPYLAMSYVIALEGIFPSRG